MIKNIIFDMSDVMFRFDTETFLDACGVEGEDRTLLELEVFRSMEWAMVDLGALKEAEALERMCRNLPERLHGKARELVFGWDRAAAPMPGVAELVKELKERGYRIYLLSNAGTRHWEYWKNVPGSEYFDDTLFSADVLLVKPQPEIFLHAFSKFGIDPGESLFIDDNTMNIAIASCCGLKGIVFHGDIMELRKKLIAMDVNCSV